MSRSMPGKMRRHVASVPSNTLLEQAFFAQPPPATRKPQNQEVVMIRHPLLAGAFLFGLPCEGCLKGYIWASQQITTTPSDVENPNR